MFKERIKQIASLLKDFHSLVDVGTDHAYLPIYLALNYDYQNILATDINDGPLESDKKNISHYKLDNVIHTLKTDGIEGVDSDYDCLSICGMGGVLIKDILERGIDKLEHFEYILLSPNNNQYYVRKFLADNGYLIVDEINIFDQKYYEVIMAKKVLTKIEYSELELKYGPILLAQKNDLFVKYYTDQLEHLKSKNSPYLNDQIEEIKKVLKY